jgi:hypothetical protein
VASAIDPTKPADGTPAVKAELRANLQAAKGEIEALQAGKLEAGAPIDMAGAVLSRAEIRNYSESLSTPSVQGGGLVLDLAQGNVFEIVLSANVTSLAFANPPVPGRAGVVTLIVRQDASGGRTLAWPAAIRWAGGVAPVVSSDGQALDVYNFITRDGGTSWLGFPAGQAFA